MGEDKSDDRRWKNHEDEGIYWLVAKCAPMVDWEFGWRFGVRRAVSKVASFMFDRSGHLPSPASKYRAAKHHYRINRANSGM